MPALSVCKRCGLWRPHPSRTRRFFPSLRPVVTLRRHFHRVVSRGTTWVFSIRGPWSKTWREYDPKTDRYVTLTHGRKIVDEVHP